jgi:hypothetical protein
VHYLLLVLYLPAEVNVEAVEEASLNRRGNQRKALRVLGKGIRETRPKHFEWDIQKEQWDKHYRLGSSRG